MVRWFWEIVDGMDKEDLALLVQFVTGTSKVPLDGFAALQGVHGPQKFQIHKAYGDVERLPTGEGRGGGCRWASAAGTFDQRRLTHLSPSPLPTAHTCFNQLDILEYATKEQLRERLMMALHEGSEGFGFA